MTAAVGLARDAAANAVVRPENRGGSLSLLQHFVASSAHVDPLQDVAMMVNYVHRKHGQRI